MKTIKLTLTLFTAIAFVCIPLLPTIARAQTTQDQNQASPIMRGYRTGYSDGYQAAVSDVSKNANREFRNKAEYDRADRAFNSAGGSLVQNDAGYRRGLEGGCKPAQ